MADIDEEALFRGANDEDEDAQGPSSAGRSRDDDPWVKGAIRAKGALALVLMTSILVLMMFSTDDKTRRKTEVSMRLAGYEGLRRLATRSQFRPCSLSRSTSRTLAPSCRLGATSAGR